VATITASDALSGVATLTVTATSSEPDRGTGGGDVPGDIVINGGIVQLRAERSPSGKGRTYTINATAVDVAGNAATSTATCQVSKWSIRLVDQNCGSRLEEELSREPAFALIPPSVEPPERLAESRAFL